MLSHSILKLTLLIDEQNALLRRKDQRREWAGLWSTRVPRRQCSNTSVDKSRQPIPEVPATSSSAWNALLRSTMTDVIQPKAEGWRSGLDALLVFVGLLFKFVSNHFEYLCD